MNRYAVVCMESKRQALQVIESELDKLRKRIIDRHIMEGQRASGRTIQSLRVVMEGDRGILYGRRAIQTLEDGRKPGKVPYKFRLTILQWMKDKGIQVKSPNSFAYLVARKIANEGTKLYREGGRSDIYSPEIEKTIEEIHNKVFGIFAEDIQHINTNANENV